MVRQSLQSKHSTAFQGRSEHLLQCDTFEAEGMILQPKSQDPVVRVMDAINEGSALS
jgi:hypothetical protein